MSKHSLNTPLFPADIFELDFEHVYEPAEDTFLLIDAIEKDLESIMQLNPSIVLEVGCGSGAVITSLAQAIGSSCACFATDINDQALLTTQKCGSANGIPNRINLVRSNLADALVDQLRASVDVLIFNPPYVPTESAEISRTGSINAAWAGGRTGIEVTLEFIKQVPLLLSRKGCCFLVVLKQNHPENLITLMKSSNLSGEIFLQRRCGIEHLYILKITRVY